MPRDLRDPQKLGEWLESQRTADRDKSLSYWADIVEIQCGKGIVSVPDYDHGESLATVTAREYRDELERRAADGDRYAKSVLAGYPNDDPGGQ